MCDCFANCCKCYDNLCCSLYEKVFFFAYWTLIHAMFLIVLAATDYTRYGSLMLFWYVVFCFVVFLHLVAGILSMIGVYLENYRILIAGYVISCVFPALHMYLIYLPAAQIFLGIGVCKYCNQLKNKGKENKTD